MTWFGIVLLFYWITNIMGSIYYAGRGGMESTPGSLLFTALLIQPLLIIGLLFVGTGFGI